MCVCVCVCARVHLGAVSERDVWGVFDIVLIVGTEKGRVWGPVREVHSAGLGQRFCVCVCVCMCARVCVCVFLQGVYLQVLYRHCEALKVSPWGCPSTNSNYHQITEIMGDPTVKNLTPLSQTLSLLLFPPSYGHFTAQQSLGLPGKCERGRVFGERMRCRESSFQSIREGERVRRLKEDQNWQEGEREWKGS